MTSTSTSSGYSLQRNSSKVIQPPGGKTADIFGRSIPEAPAQNPLSASSQAGSDVGMSQQIARDYQTSPTPSGDSAGQQQTAHQQQQQQADERQQHNQPLLTPDDFKPVAQESFQAQSTQQQSDIPYNERTAAQQAKINVPLRRNPITGEVYQDNAAQAPVRVRQPPGGRSSGIF